MSAVRLREGLAISPLIATVLVVVGLLVYSGPASIESVLLGAMMIAFHARHFRAGCWFAKPACQDNRVHPCRATPKDASLVWPIQRHTSFECRGANR